MSEVPVVVCVPLPVSLPYRRAAMKALILICCMTVAGHASAQSEAQEQAQPTKKPAQQQIAPVNTTVVVHGDVSGNYLPD
jgi:hypothetical protein